MKTKQLVVAVAIVGLGFAGVSAMAGGAKAPGDPQVSPFTDVLTVNYSGIPDSSANVTYSDNNGVSITGEPTVAPGSSSPQVSIHSDNLLESGYPSMTINADGQSCTLTYLDGPYVADLDFSAGKPQCDHFTIGDVVSDDQYHYHLDISYNG